MNAAESVIDYIVDGLATELELERELGVKTVEIDRALLGSAEMSPQSKLSLQKSASPGKVSFSAPAEKPPKPRIEPPRDRESNADGAKKYDVVFLHDRPLPENGVEMMAKIITAMGLTAETAPLVVTQPVPSAKITIVLGGLAMRKHFPGMSGEPGQWLKSPDGRDVLITYSPAYIIRFTTITPAVDKMKREMWRSLKVVVQRLRGIGGADL